MADELAHALGSSPEDRQSLREHLARPIPDPDRVITHDLDHPIAGFGRLLAAAYTGNSLSLLAAKRNLHRRRDESDASVRARLCADAAARLASEAEVRRRLIEDGEARSRVDAMEQARPFSKNHYFNT
ncbi:MAG: hypothetical protein ACRBN8_46375 [Nannocystales bacterium]